MKCPGQDLGRKNPADVVYDLPCYNCGNPVEFFFDDLHRICPNCKARVEKDDEHLLKDYGCAAWCREAEKCLGVEWYARFREISKNKEAIKDGGLEECVKKD